jgi:predicted component of type VI protein secretion system
LADTKRERDELDAELPASSGSIDARLREAEVEMRDLERLIPVRTERENAEQRHEAAKMRLAGAQEAVKEARQRWKAALRSVGLPEDFAPPKVKQVVKSNEHVLELRRRRDARKDELDQRERELLLLNNRLQQIAEARSRSCGFAS